MYDFLRPALFRLNAERAHTVAATAARLAELTRTDSLLQSNYEYENDRLEQTLFGLRFINPVGLAAGFDKNASLLDFWPTLGFGFVEVGSVTARPSKGNPKPRAFRLPDDGALINRMGLNNKGAEKIARRLEKLDAERRMIVGVNIAKTHDPAIMGDDAVADFCESYRLLAPHADYVVLNVSCPNTREGKTFEDPSACEALLKAIGQERARLPRHVPLLIKLSPPLSERVAYDSDVEGIVELGNTYAIDGYIATNTASDREGLQTPVDDLSKIGEGGLSGRPLAARSTHLVRYLYRLTNGAVPIIGVGGVFSPEDAYAKIRAGASLIQIYTALVYEGPSLVRRIKEGLMGLLERDGFFRLSDAVGVDA